jgi:hypothetical protein
MKTRRNKSLPRETKNKRVKLLLQLLPRKRRKKVKMERSKNLKSLSHLSAMVRES